MHVQRGRHRSARHALRPNQLSCGAGSLQEFRDVAGGPPSRSDAPAGGARLPSANSSEQQCARAAAPCWVPACGGRGGPIGRISSGAGAWMCITSRHRLRRPVAYRCMGHWRYARGASSCRSGQLALSFELIQQSCKPGRELSKQGNSSGCPLGFLCTAATQPAAAGTQPSAHKEHSQQRNASRCEPWVRFSHILCA